MGCRYLLGRALHHQIWMSRNVHSARDDGFRNQTNREGQMKEHLQMSKELDVIPLHSECSSYVHEEQVFNASTTSELNTVVMASSAASGALITFNFNPLIYCAHLQAITLQAMSDIPGNLDMNLTYGILIRFTP